MGLSKEDAHNLFESKSHDELINEASQGSVKRINFYAPSFIRYGISGFSNKPKDYPAISITGLSCSLDCEHCGKKLLESMIIADTPEKLLEVCMDLDRSGSRGALISGGANQRGEVPLERFIPALKRIKEETSLTLAVHTGLATIEVSEGLADAGVDLALIDIIGDKSTIKSVYHLDREPSDFEESMRFLRDAGVEIAPHVVVGLDWGRIKGEFNAIEMAKNAGSRSLVLVGLMPYSGTGMSDTKPPSVEDFSKVISLARLMMDDSKIILGCARERKTKSVLDVLALRSGIDAIAHPSESAIDYTRENDYDIIFNPTCCAEIALNLR